MLLALPKVYSRASSYTLARLIKNALIKYSIIEKTAYYIANNYTANNKALTFLSLLLLIPNLNPIKNCIRCTDYVIALSVNASISKNINKDALKNALALNANNAVGFYKLKLLAF
jgi:hypothetical protein